MSAHTPTVSDALWALIEKGTMIPNVKKTQIYTYPPHFDGKKIKVEWSIDIEQFKNIAKKNGGRAGIIPFFFNNSEPHYLLNMSAPKTGKKSIYGNLLSDFGGGTSMYETIYEGFTRELEEEIPKWKNELLRTIENLTENDLIHCIETMFVDKEKDDAEAEKGFVRHRILVICQVDPSTLLYGNDNKLLYEDGVKPSKEVERLTVKSYSELAYFLTDPSNNIKNQPKMNSGLEQFKTIYYLS